MSVIIWFTNEASYNTGRAVYGNKQFHFEQIKSHIAINEVHLLKKYVNVVLDIISCNHYCHRYTPC